jgi:hypothetical protein
MNGAIKLKCGKRSSVLGPFVNHEKNEVFVGHCIVNMAPGVLIRKDLLSSEHSSRLLLDKQ